VPRTAEAYRLRAAQFLKSAAETPTPSLAPIYSGLASAYHRLAESRSALQRYMQADETSGEALRETPQD
jgi:hypothetical protein